MREVVASPDLVAYCGLYCGACKSYLRGRCEGCHKNTKATWCGVRSCCQGKELASCAGCSDFTDVRRCAKFNNFMAKLFGLVFRSDRAACVDQIRRVGLEGHAQEMARQRLQTIRRTGA